MTKSSENLLKTGKAKLMVVDEKFAQDIQDLSNKMKTSPKDVVSAAIELLKLSLSREVIFREKETGSEVTLPFFKSLSRQVKIKGRDE